MSNLPIPYLDLPLREVFSDNIFRDESGHRRNASGKGEAEIVDDERFTTCLQLRRGTLTTPGLKFGDFPSGITLVCWFKGGGSQRVLSLGLPNQTPLLAVAFEQGRICYLVNGARIGLFAAGSDYRSEAWNFLSIVADADGRMTLTISDGANSTSDTIACTVLSRDMPALLALGDASAPPGGAALRVARVRVYDRQLSPAELERIVQSARPQLRGRDGIPITLSLEDARASCALSIQPRNHTLTLRAMPNVATPLILQSVAGPPGPSSWHFRIGFRRGTLQDFGSLTLAPNLGRLQPVAEATEDALYLIATGDHKLPIQMAIAGFRADATQGPRVTRVSLAYRNVSWYLDGKSVPIEDRQTALFTLHAGSSASASGGHTP